jgi:predicted nucleic-acid-binding protein
VQLDVESSNDVAAAIEDYRRGVADFADCLLVRVNAANGCTHTVTFDRKAAKLARFESLESG